MTETWATVSAAALVMLILGTGAYMRGSRRPCSCSS